jgi:hypothetical protein
MEKTAGILGAALIAAAGLQIAAVNFILRGSSYIDVLKGVDLTALQSAFGLVTILF